MVFVGEGVVHTVQDRRRLGWKRVARLKGRPGTIKVARRTEGARHARVARRAERAVVS